MKHAFATVLVLSGMVVCAQEADVIKDNPVFYSVPDIPAFKALNTEPTNTLKPSDPEGLSAAASEFYRGAEIVIPSTFALEVSPGILWDKAVDSESPEGRARISPWKSSRISVATKRDTSTSISSAAIGFRATFLLGSQYRTDGTYRQNLQRIQEIKLLRDVNEFRTNAMERYLRENNLTDLEVATDAVKKEKAEKYIQSELQKFRDPDAALEKIRKDFGDSTWNSEKIDLAIAISGSSPDSLAKNLAFSGLYVWISYVSPIANKSGGLLVTGSFSTTYDYAVHKSNFTPGISVRSYFGNNNMKAYGELHARYEQASESPFANGGLGAEMLLGNGMWLEFEGGLEQNLKSGTWTPKANTGIKMNLAALGANR